MKPVVGSRESMGNVTARRSLLPRLAGGGFLLIAIMSGCTSTQTPSRTSATAVLDATTGSVTLPFDAYWPTLEDTNRLSLAADTRVAACMDRAGQDYVADPAAVTPGYQSWARYGVWRLDDARQFGYDPPGAAEQQPSVSSAAQAALDACLVAPDLVGLRQTDYFTPETMRTYPFMRLPSIGSTEQAGQLIDQWRECVIASGFVPPEKPTGDGDMVWTPSDLADLTREEQIATAVADVKCKERLDLVKKLADLDAARQQVVIDEHKSEFEAFRQVWLPMRSAADKVLSGR